MRYAPKSDEEKKEIEAAEARQTRDGGLSLMKVRDRSWAFLRNHRGGIVRMEWPVSRQREEYETYTPIPEGMFMITIDGKTAMIDAEEMRRWLRWV